MNINIEKYHLNCIWAYKNEGFIENFQKNDVLRFYHSV